MKRLLIVAHAPSPNTKRMLDAVMRGATAEDIEGVDALALSPFDTGPDEVKSAGALIFDRCYYPCLEETEGLAYALYIRAGQDGTGTRRAVESITTGLRWRAVQEPLTCRGPWDDAFLEQCEELGQAMAAGLEAGIF
jgi:hypothetical protein